MPAPPTGRTPCANLPRPSRLDPYKPYLERRFSAGCTSATRLHGELLDKNAPRHLPDGPRLHRHPAHRTATGAASAADSAADDWLAHPHPATLSEEERAALKNVLARCHELDTAAEHVRDFGEILTNRLGATLPAWIDAVDASQLPGLTNFALHLLRDLDAVTAGLTLHRNSGGTEGAVNRIKKIKRQLYGRAGFELLRKLILLQ
jgi:transposase